MGFFDSDSKTEVDDSISEVGQQSGKSSANFSVGNSDDGARVTLTTSEDNSNFQQDNSVDNTDNSNTQIDNSDRSVSQVDNSQFTDNSDRSVNQVDNSQFVEDNSNTQIDNSNRSVSQVDNSQFSDTSKSTVTNTQTTNTTTTTNNTFSDLGAIERAFSFAGDSLDLIDRTNDRTFDAIEDFSSDAFGALESNTTETFDALGEAFDSSLTAIQSSAASETERGLTSVLDLTKNIFYVLGAIAVAGMGVYAWRAK